MKNIAKQVPVYTDGLISVVLREEEYIMEVHTKDHLYSAADVRKAIRFIRQVAGKSEYLVLICGEKKTRVTGSALKLLFAFEANSYAVAKAYVVKNRFFFMLSKLVPFFLWSAQPIAFFSTKPAAERWLKKQVEVNFAF